MRVDPDTLKWRQRRSFVVCAAYAPPDLQGTLQIRPAAGGGGGGPSAAAPAAVPAAAPAAAVPPPPPPRVYPVRDGVLTYYHGYQHASMSTMKAMNKEILKNDLMVLFDLPHVLHNVQVTFKNTELARYQVAPITFDAECTFSILDNGRTCDLFYCGMYEPGPEARLRLRGYEKLEDPPKLPPL